MLRVRLLLLPLLLTLWVHASPVVKTPQKDRVAPVDPVVHVKLGDSAVNRKSTCCVTRSYRVFHLAAPCCFPSPRVSPPLPPWCPAACRPPRPAANNKKNEGRPPVPPAVP